MNLFNSRFACIGYKLLRADLVVKMKTKFLSQDLFEIGHFEDPKLDTNYEAGQIFVHKLLGYRGLVLVPWVTHIYIKGLKEADNLSDYEPIWGVHRKQTLYYQVLIDSRDVPFTNMKNDSAPPLIRLENGLHSLPDADFTAHDDILPYTVTQKHKFQHELLEHFFSYHPDKDFCYEAKDQLKLWQEKVSKRLGLMDVYAEVTKNVCVTVVPFFVGLRKTRRFVKFYWRYTVRLENLSDLAVTVKGHRCQISYGPGSSSYKAGVGVAGVEPTLNKSQPVFQFNSFISLLSPCGHVRGILVMRREDGTSFHCNVPPFPLQSGAKCE